ATLDGVAARMTAKATPAPTVANTAGANEVNTVTFTTLTAGQSVTVGGLTYTSSGESDTVIAGKFAAAIANPGVSGGAANGFSGELDSGWTAAAAAGAALAFTSTQTGDVENIGVSTLAASTPAAQSNVRAAVDATKTATTVTFGAMNAGDSVT